MKDNILWVEKFRPDMIDDCVLPESTKKVFQDIVDSEELPNLLLFGTSGVGKTTNEISYAIDKKILLINAESKSEIIEIEKIAKSKKKIVNIGIRLNPNTDAKTINQISTGKKEDKFGLTEKNFIELVKYTKKSKYINLKCLSVHIGSQIVNNLPYEKMLKVIDRVINKSNHKFEFVDLGGGIGIPYHNKSCLLYTSPSPRD